MALLKAFIFAVALNSIEGIEAGLPDAVLPDSYRVQQLVAAFPQASLPARAVASCVQGEGGREHARGTKAAASCALTVAPASESNGLRCYFPDFAVAVFAGLAPGWATAVIPDQGILDVASGR